IRHSSGRRVRSLSGRIPSSRAKGPLARRRGPVPSLSGPREVNRPRYSRRVSAVWTRLLRRVLRRPRRDEARARALSLGLLAKGADRGPRRSPAVRSRQIRALAQRYSGCLLRGTVTFSVAVSVAPSESLQVTLIVYTREVLSFAHRSAATWTDVDTV